MANLLTILSGRAANAPVGTGMARQAVNSIQIDKEYKQHVADAIADGKEPMTKEEFIKSRQNI